MTHTTITQSNLSVSSAVVACANVPQNLSRGQDFLLRGQFTSDCSWSSFWLSKDHQEFGRMAMKKSAQELKN